MRGTNSTHNGFEFGLKRLVLLGFILFSAGQSFGQGSPATIPLSGRFNGKGIFSRQFIRAEQPVEIALQVHLEEGSDQITGTINAGGVVSSVFADRGIDHSSQNPAPSTGRYTLMLSAGEEAGVPQGTGFALATIAAAGNMRIVGMLPDSATFTHNGFVTKQATSPIYSALYGGRGSVFGTMEIAETSDANLQGTLQWFRPAIPHSAAFPNGFATTLQISGSRFLTRARGELPLNANLDRNVNVHLAGGSLEDQLDIAAVLASPITITAPAGDPARLRLSVSPLTGIVIGSFLHPVTGRLTIARGVVLQKQNVAGGLFAGSDQTGSFLITPIK